MIKSKINGIPTKKEIPFPKLMVTKRGTVILATGMCGSDIRGTRLVVADEESTIGYHSNAWTASEFEDFNGSITMSNI